MITLVYLCAFGKIQFEPNLYWPHFSHSRLYIVWLCHNASVAAVLLLSLLLFLLSFWFVFVDGTFYNNDHIENKFEENFLLAVLVIACSAENIDVSLFMDVGWHKNWARVRNVGKSMPKRSCVSKFYVRRKHTQLKLARTFQQLFPMGNCTFYVVNANCKLCEWAIELKTPPDVSTGSFSFAMSSIKYLHWLFRISTTHLIII